MILEATAERNRGLCAPCDTRRGIDELEAQKQAFRKNPPKSQAEIDQIAPDTMENFSLRMFLQGLLPPRIDPDRFTEKDFTQAMKDIVSECGSDKQKLCGEFLGLCDFIFDPPQLSTGLAKMPRPFREAIAVYQFWGMTTSNGMEAFFDNTQSDQVIDHEVERGLKLLGCGDFIPSFQAARKLFDPSKGIPAKFESELTDRFYQKMADFEINILGPFLIQESTL